MPEVGRLFFQNATCGDFPHIRASTLRERGMKHAGELVKKLENGKISRINTLGGYIKDEDLIKFAENWIGKDVIMKGDSFLVKNSSIKVANLGHK